MKNKDHSLDDLTDCGNFRGTRSPLILSPPKIDGYHNVRITCSQELLHVQSF